MEGGKMDAAKLASFLRMGPFTADQHYVGFTNTMPGFGNILLRCNAARCPDGTVIDAAEVAAHIAEILNGLM